MLCQELCLESFPFPTYWVLLVRRYTINYQTFSSTSESVNAEHTLQFPGASTILYKLVTHLVFLNWPVWVEQSRLREILPLTLDIFTHWQTLEYFLTQNYLRNTMIRAWDVSTGWFCVWTVFIYLWLYSVYILTFVVCWWSARGYIGKLHNLTLLNIICYPFGIILR
jgi:hypothetical protein